MSQSTILTVLFLTSTFLQPSAQAKQTKRSQHSPQHSPSHATASGNERDPRYQRDMRNIEVARDIAKLLKEREASPERRDDINLLISEIRYGYAKELYSNYSYGDATATIEDVMWNLKQAYFYLAGNQDYRAEQMKKVIVEMYRDLGGDPYDLYE